MLTSGISLNYAGDITGINFCINIPTEEAREEFSVPPGKLFFFFLTCFRNNCLLLGKKKLLAVKKLNIVLGIHYIDIAISTDLEKFQLLKFNYPLDSTQ